MHHEGIEILLVLFLTIVNSHELKFKIKIKRSRINLIYPILLRYMFYTVLVSGIRKFLREC